MTTVLMIDDHTLVRQSLVKTVAAEDGFEVIGDTDDCDDALRIARRTDPDVVVIDVAMPGSSGLDVAVKLKRQQPDIKIVFLSMHDDDATVHRAMRIGADAYIVKSASTEELLQGLHAVGRGGSYLSPAVARRIMDFASASVHTRLTERELEILRLMAEGSRIPDVASQLFMSSKTVKNHLTSIYSKLGVSSGAQAVAEAFRRGLVATGGVA